MKPTGLALIAVCATTIGILILPRNQGRKTEEAPEIVVAKQNRYLDTIKRAITRAAQDNPSLAGQRVSFEEIAPFILLQGKEPSESEFYQALESSGVAVKSLGTFPGKDGENESPCFTVSRNRGEEEAAEKIEAENRKIEAAAERMVEECNKTGQPSSISLPIR